MPNGEKLEVPFGQFMPPEFSQSLFENLEAFRQRQEQESTRRFLEGINALGRLHTGSALRGAMETVLGPAMERRQQLMGQIALQGPMLGREERLGEVGFGRQKEVLGLQQGFQERMARFQAEQQMAQLMKQIQAQREMAEWQEEQRGGLGGFLGGLGGIFAGGLAGGLGGGLAGKWLK